MLSTEVRELMVKAYEKSHNATEVARNFSVSRETVYEKAMSLLWIICVLTMSKR